jgi:hypothetical protein
MKKLRRSKDRKKSTNREEIGKKLKTFCRRQQDGSVDFVRRRELTMHSYMKQGLGGS